MPRTYLVVTAAAAVLMLATLAADAQGSRRSASSPTPDATVETTPATPTPPPPPPPPPPEPEPEPEPAPAEVDPPATEGQALPNFEISDAPPAAAPDSGTGTANPFPTLPGVAATDPFATDAAPSVDAKLPAPAPLPDGIEFGDDSSEYANDGECDDRRFRGSVMATSLTLEHTGHDATDCRNGLSHGLLSLWDFNRSIAATACSNVDFGTNASEYANDNQCDDPRFEGVGMAAVVRPDDSGVDAADCSRLCTLGMIGLRDY